MIEHGDGLGGIGRCLDRDGRALHLLIPLPPPETQGSLAVNPHILQRSKRNLPISVL
jgi:hypothetical protein